MSSSPLSTSNLLMGLLARFWSFVFLAFLIMGCSRVILWLGYIDPSRFPGWSALGPGMRLGAFNDTAVACVFVLFWLVFLSPGLLVSPARRPKVLSLAVVFLKSTLIALILLSAIEFYYYGFYHSRFGPLVFGLAENDTGSVLEAIWKNYPVVQVVVGCCTLGLLISWVFNKIYQFIEFRLNRKGHPIILTFICLSGLAFLCIPLVVLGPSKVVQHHIQVTVADELGVSLPNNSPMSFVHAFNMHQEALNLGDNPSVDFKTYGFTGLADAAMASGMSNVEPAAVEKEMFKVAPGPISNQHPNVIIAQLESFGADLLNTDAPDNDMLGRLRSHLSKEDWFTHFYAGQNATHPEIENMILGSPITPLTLGEGRNFTYQSSGILPFKRAGYKSIYICGCTRGWQNMANVLLNQGFDEIYDERDVMKMFPDAGKTSWGVYDSYLFKFVQVVLDKESKPGHPVLIFFITNTNHPPFVLDTPRRDLPLNPSAMGPRGNSNMKLRRDFMATYQYQADQFGGFLDGLDSSQHAQDTIVAAMGDHNLHAHYKYKLPEEKPDTDRIFALFKVPPKWRPDYPVNRDRFAGQKDVIPTLVSLALPGSSYFDTGINLYGKGGGDGYGLSEYSHIYVKQGMIDGLGLRPSFYPWTKPNARVTGQAQPLPEELKPLVREISANVALRDWYIRKQVIEHAAHQKKPSTH